MASLFKRDNGVFYSVTCRRGGRVWKSLGTKDEEQAKLLFAEIQLSSQKPAKQTLKEFWLSIKPIMEKELSKNSIDFYDYIVHQVSLLIGNKRLRSYSVLDFDRYKVLRLSEIKKITANKEIRTLRALFERAVRYGYMESNPVRRCNIFKIDQSVPQILSMDQFNYLLTFIKEKELRDVVMMAVLTAMRAGELVHLEWNDIDLLGRVIAVKNKPAHRVKTGKERLVPMSTAVYAILSRLERKGERVFYKSDGQPYSVKFVSDKFRKYRKQAGLSEGIHVHSLRHTSLTWMHHNGIPSESLRHIAGHSSIQTTHIYTHALPSHLLEAVNTLNNNVTSINPKQINENCSACE